MRVLLLAPLLLSVGCITTSIGRGPTDLDLNNDGTPQAQQALQKRYAIAYATGNVLRPGATPEQVSAEIQDTIHEVRAPAWSDEVSDYLASSLPAEEATDTPAISLDRFAHSSTPSTMIFAGSVLVGAALGVIGAADGNRIDAATLGNMTWGAFSGALAGMIFSVPISIVYWWTIPLVSSSVAAGDYKRGTRAFNKDLEARIVAGASPVPVPVAAPAAVPDAPVPVPVPAPDAPPPPLDPATPPG